MPVIEWCRHTPPRPVSAIATMFRFRICMENRKPHQSGQSPAFRRPTSRTRSSILSMRVSSFKKRKTNSSITRPDRKVFLEQVARIDVHEDRLAIRLKPAGDEGTSDAADDHLLSIPWQKPPSRKS